MDLGIGLVLGTMYFGTRTDEATSYALLDRYVEAGGRVLDTANCYSFWTSPTGHGGQSEALLGRWLAANPGLRDELVIATKVGVEPTDDGGVEGLSAAVIERESERSLERLGIDAIDVYWAHGEDRATELEEIDLWVYSPLIQGSFDRADRPFPDAYDHPGTTERLAELTRVAEAHGVPRSQVVLAWMLARDWKPIVGVSSVEQFDSALASVQPSIIQLGADLLAVDSLP
jgi:aryl-alcohol dehydrogenase-like predicted oxidoreductase